ncbi:LuxR C-terminal-related transcriptional regulator [Pseudoroseicyclus sp. H15]
MSDGAENDESHLEDAVINGVYEVAIDPRRYEALLDRWQSLVARRQMQEGEGAQLSRVSPHVSRAEQTLSRMIEAEQNSAEAVLSTITHNAAFVVDSSLTVTAANRAATASIGMAAGARLEHLETLVIEKEPLVARARQLLQGNSGAPQILRLHGSRTGKAVLISYRRYESDTGAPELLVVTSEMAWPPAFAELLRSTFSLTVAETEVMRALSEGTALADIAEARGRSVETVRAQLKSVMAKTETSSQIELVRLTLSMLELSRFSGPAEGEPAQFGVGANASGLPPRPIHQMTLPDGRRMEYLILGDPKGRPCLYLPLDYGLTRWPASAEVAAARAGIRIIVPIRAGYGASDPLPAKTAELATRLAEDHIALLAHLGVGPLPIVMMGDDAPIAFRIHRLAPERISAIIGCAPMLPLTGPEQLERMGKWHRFVLAGARYTPHLLPFMVQAGFALARKAGKRAFLESVYQNSAADMATFEVPEVFEALVTGSDVALSKTHMANEAFTNELLMKVRNDWRADVTFTEGRVPVHVLAGLQDPQVPKQTVEENRLDYPWIETQVFPDAGQLLFFLKWRDVLPLILRYLS